MMSPMQFLREAIRAVPAVRYALGIGGIVASIAIVYSFNLDPRVAILGTIIMMTLMSVLVVFARLASLAGPRLLLPAQVMTWFTLLLFITLSVTLFLSVFFRQPLDLSCWMTRDCPATPTPATVYTPYVSQFVATSPSNKSFDEVSGVFEKELLRTQAAGLPEVTRPDVTKLIEHFLTERYEYYQRHRVPISDDASATKGSSGGHKRAPLLVQCPADTRIVAETVQINGVGGCYKEQVTNTTAAGTVSQTGKGRSACTLSAMCAYTEDFIQAELRKERAALLYIARS